jgi:hypothetical protein
MKFFVCFSSEFIEDVRRVLGVPEWMLLVDTRHTRNIQNDRCVQFKVHFYGPVATRIEQDLSQLLTRGQLDSPTIQVHGSHVDPKRSKTIPYHVCDESDNGIFLSFLNLFSYICGLISPSLVNSPTTAFECHFGRLIDFFCSSAARPDDSAHRIYVNHPSLFHCWSNLLNFGSYR